MRPTTSRVWHLIGCLLLLGMSGSAMSPDQDRVSAPVPSLPHPILFVTQVPVAKEYSTIGAIFANHLADPKAVARGGALWIRYPDGTLKNLTHAAGYGMTGFQGGNAIAVRSPSVSWDGSRAVFSMVVGAPMKQHRWGQFTWQLYEIDGLAPTDVPLITKVRHQPDFNNVSPIYGTDDRIIFVSDRPRGGERHLYPQRDEYDQARSTTGLWSLDPASGTLFLMEHSPSGSFTPILDSFGRVIFTRWDHLERDQLADEDEIGNGDYETFNYADETPTAAALDTRVEVFPEPRPARTDLLAGTNLTGHKFNHFFPWQVNEDGTEQETLNHVGRHELHNRFRAALTDDPNLKSFSARRSGRVNPNSIENFLQITEDPLNPGVYFGIDSRRFKTRASGQILSITGAPTVSADHMTVTYVTHRDTRSITATPGPDHSGHYRHPLPLSDGTLVAAHTPETREDANDGTRSAPLTRYDFRLKTLAQRLDGLWEPDLSLTAGISEMVSYWDPNVLVTYSGLLWELDPVEVRARPRPPRREPVLPLPERQIMTEESVDVAALRGYLSANDLALIVSHDVTTRDDADRQPPFNLRVSGTATQTVGASGKIYDVALMQFFQADQIRGVGGPADPWPGRRVLAQPLHQPGLLNLPGNPAVPGSVALGPDGSMAAFVPARRALAWQLTDGAGVPVVRERYWLNFQPGEIRVCGSCHGANETDQAGQLPPTNPPEALRQLLRSWKQVSSDLDGDGMPTAWEAQFGLDTTVGTGDGGATGDPDGDGKTNWDEYLEGTHPRGFNTRYFAEGASGAFFDTSVALANPDPGTAASVLIRFLRSDGTTFGHYVSMPPMSRRSVDTTSFPELHDVEFATVVESDVAIVADRTMAWDRGNYGSHAESSLAAPSSTWYLAEGATHSGFNLFYLLQNPSDTTAEVEITYLRPAPEGPVVKVYGLAPRSRLTVWVNREDPALGSTDLSAVVVSTNDVPIIAERAMYLNTGDQIFGAGHASAGVTDPATSWYLAEGATGDYFDLFIPMANPTDAAASVDARYMLPDGSAVTRTYTVPARTRFTVWVDREDPRLASTAVSTTLTSTNGVPVIAERTMWWPGPSLAAWQEAHNSPGATTTGTAWGLAEGEVGGANGTETYILIANTSAIGSDVRVTLLFEEGAPIARSFPVGPNSRFSVSIAAMFPEAVDRRFGAVVESLGASPAQIVVERAMYSNAGGVPWAAGTNAVATRLR